MVCQIRVPTTLMDGEARVSMLSGGERRRLQLLPVLGSVYTAKFSEHLSRLPSSQRNLGKQLEVVFSTWSSGMYTAFIETWYPS